jgi:hypothetical protein
MLTLVEKAAAYLEKLEADRVAALAVSEEKALEAKLIKARQEGFQQAMEFLGVEGSSVFIEPKHKEPRRAKRRNIPDLILTELSFSGTEMTTSQIAAAIDYLPERTEKVLQRLESSGQIMRNGDGRWITPIATAPQGDGARANGKYSMRNGRT